MSLYLAGQSIESTLVVACDGISAREQDKKYLIVETSRKKIIGIAREVVMGCTGGGLGAQIFKSFYTKALSLRGKEDVDAYVPPPLSVLTPFLNRYKVQLAGGEAREPTDIGIYYYNGTGWCVSGFSFSVSGTEPSISKYNFSLDSVPFYARGITKNAKEILFRLCLEDPRTDYSSDFLKGLFVYILTESECNVVGGRFRVKEYFPVSLGGRVLSSTDEDMVRHFQKAEEIRESLSDQEITREKVSRFARTLLIPLFDLDNVIGDLEDIYTVTWRYLESIGNQDALSELEKGIESRLHRSR